MIVRSAYSLLCFLLLVAPLAARAAPEAAERAMQAADAREWNQALVHARASGDITLISLIDWQYMLDSDSGAGFAEIMRFVSANPDWPDLTRLRVRAELSLRDMPVNDDVLLAVYRKDDPLTGIGRIALADALMRQPHPPTDRVEKLVKDAWKDGDFDEAQEKDIRSRYDRFLSQKDDIARTDRLLWEEKISAAERMLPRLPKDYQRLFETRIALIGNKRTASALLGRVDREHRKDPGLIYDRMRYKARRGDDKGARQMLLSAPSTVPYPEKWWRWREAQIREAIDERDYKTARKLLANHGQTDGVALADATWLDGWIQLEFLRESKKAYGIFRSMYEAVSYPISRARAAYWAARAAGRTGDNAGAAEWYAKAASYPTTFYGQLAVIRQGKGPLRIAMQPSSSSRRYDGNDLVRAARLCMALGEQKLASRLINHMIETAQDEDFVLFAAALGHEAKLPYLSVRGAKKALQRNMVLLDIGYPEPEVPVGLPVEKALALGITRQESEFDTHAKSPSGALGLMQLLPATARDMSRKLDMPYSKAMLFTPDYNMTLGSYYLSRLISAYDGSYVMAIAAYNAGPGNVSKWTKTIGTPGNNIDSAVNWIEKIPFAETRNYVQRVLENMQVYRYMEPGQSRLLLAEDLTR